MNQKKTHSFIIFIAVLITGNAWAGDRVDCLSLATAHQYKQAFPICLKVAKEGDGKAQGKVGKLYMYGRGVEQDEAAAIYWFHKAAVQGEASAQVALGKFYGNPKDKRHNYAKALKWLRLAEKHGDKEAPAYLGRMYEMGNGITRNTNIAGKWYYKAGLMALNDGDVMGASLMLMMIKNLHENATSYASKLEEKIKAAQ